MKKIGKILIGIVIVVVVVVLALILTLPMTIGPIVKTAASVGGPKALGVPVSVGDVKLNPFAGNLTVSKVKVGNPTGYSDKDAFAVDKVEIQLNLASLMSDTIVIKKIQIDAPAISFESKDGQSNFDTMMANAKSASKEDKKSAPAEKKPGKKIIIEEFTLNSGKVAFSSKLTMGKSMTLPLPSITVRDIGKSSGGASAVDALTEIMNAILGGLSQAFSGTVGAAGDLLKGIGGAASDATKGATDALKSATENAEKSAKAASDATANAAETAEETVKTATDAAANAAKSAEAAAKKATDKLKKLNLFGK